MAKLWGRNYYQVYGLVTSSLQVYRFEITSEGSFLEVTSVVIKGNRILTTGKKGISRNISIHRRRFPGILLLLKFLCKGQKSIVSDGRRDLISNNFNTVVVLVWWKEFLLNGCPQNLSSCTYSRGLRRKED